MKLTSREIRLRARPNGAPVPGDFELVDASVADPGPGQVLVRNAFMSVDPYMRGRMSDRASYVAPFALGAPLDGGAVGHVIASRDASLPEGTAVLSQRGWRECFVADAGAVQAVDADAAPLVAYLGVLGMPGLTAYVGLLDVAKLRDGETVFVSAASGAVGSLVCQLAKLRGCRVVGSAGSAAKVAYLRDALHVDHAFSHRDGRAADQLRAGAPDGIDVYFDSVGGDQLQAAIGAMRPHGRIALCGAISRYNATEPMPGPNNLGLAVGKRLMLQGFIVSDWAHRRPDFVAEVGGHLRTGRIVNRETVVDGIERAPQALIDLLGVGDQIGKLLVRL